MTIRIKQTFPFVIFFGVLFICISLPVKSQLLIIDSQENVEVSGKIKAQILTSKRCEIGDVDNHYVALIDSKGVNLNKGANDFMDGAQVSNLITSDYINGTGPFNGYLKFAKNGDIVCIEWSGYMRTLNDKNGRLYFSGSFNFSKGTGIYEAIRGVGLFEGEFISEDQYIVEWKGRYSLGMPFAF